MLKELSIRAKMQEKKSKTPQEPVKQNIPQRDSSSRGNLARDTLLVEFCSELGKSKAQCFTILW